MKHSVLLLLLIVGITFRAHGQIIYTDVVPDTLIDGLGTQHYYLDLNNDGTTDFDMRHLQSLGNCEGTCGPVLYAHSVSIAPLGTNAVEDSISLPASLVPMESIGPIVPPALNWSISVIQVLATRLVHCVASGGPHCAPIPVAGYWNNVSLTSPRYIGLRFDFDGNTYYGWARLSIPTGGYSFTLKDYAYNSVPDELILAGDTGDLISTGIARIAHPNVQVSPNPFSSTLSISIGAGKPGLVTCTVRSLTGQALVTRSIAGSSGRFNLDLASLAPGIYMLDMAIAGERIVRKVMKE